MPQERLHVVDDGDEIAVGPSELRVLYTPGHAIHHVAFFDERLGDSFPVTLRVYGWKFHRWSVHQLRHLT